jgi:hypothetical protein
MRDHFKVLLLSWAIIVPLHAVQDDLRCVTEMEVPQMRHAIVNTPGHVHAIVVIGRDGKLKSFDAKATTKILVNEVEALLKYHTQYSSACVGETVLLDFTYVIEGEATDDLRWRVLFRPPNQFTIVSRPVKPIADILPK